MTVAATQISGSPWLSFSGIFGRIDSSLILESSLSRSWGSGHWIQLGATQTSTKFSPGLVTKISDIYSVFGAVGWSSNNWKIYGGIEPYVISGRVSLRLPARVDTQGVLHYTDHDIKIKNSATGFVALRYQIQEKTHSWSIMGASNTRGNNYAGIDYQHRF